MKYLFSLSVALLTIASFTTSCLAQVGINQNGNQPHQSAGLDIDFPDKGMLIPRMTTTQRDQIQSPAHGLYIFNTSTDCFNYWNGTSWKQICGDCDFPNPLASNGGAVCEGSTIQLFALFIPGAEYVWNGPSGFTSILQNPTIDNASALNSGVYSVTATLNGCASQPQTSTVLVSPLPAQPNASGNSPVCAGQPIQLTAPAVPGASYFWTGPDGFSSTAQSPMISSSSSENAGEYLVSITQNGCLSPPGSVSIAVNQPPNALFNANPSSGSVGSPVLFTAAQPGLPSYAWSFPSGSPTSSSSSFQSVTWSTGGSYQVSLTATSNGCQASTSQTIQIQEPISQTFLYTGSIVTWQVPAGVTSLEIEAWGAQGGNTSLYQGGLGAYAKGTFAVSPGQTLKILVGGKGQNGSTDHGNCGGGGGGTFVSTASNSPMLVAGGGGGAGTASSPSVGTPDPGQAGTSGTAGKGNGLSGGSGGNAAPGVCGGCGATSGAGFFTNSQAYAQAGFGTAAQAFINGGNGSQSNLGYFGGYGGGGAGAYGAGGAGGYSGGGSGNYTSTSDNSGGGGGGSFNGGTNATTTAGVNFDDGKVIITYSP